MKIIYVANYLGPQFLKSFCKGKSFSVSATLKSTAIARALLKAGHEVTIFSPGVTVCNRLIKSHDEKIAYPEGELLIVYSRIMSFRKCSFFNSLFLWYKINNKLKRDGYDLILYYNVTLDAAINLYQFRKSLRVLEYEDNIFNKSLRGNKNRLEWVKKQLFNYVINRTDAAIIVGKGMLGNNKLNAKVMVPGALNEDVLKNINFKQKYLEDAPPAKLMLAGGIHYSKGADLVINALRHIDYPCELSFYGSGNFDKETEALLRSVPNKHKVINYGFVPHDELIRVMTNHAHILLNSTRNMSVVPNSEGYPFKMMEYASTGRPIVSSRIGRLDDAFNELVTFYENEDPIEIAGAITNVIINYDECAKKALKLQNRVVEEFSIDNIALKLEQFFNKIKMINGN